MTIEQNKATNEYCMKVGGLLGIIYIIEYVILVLAADNMLFSLLRAPLMACTPIVLAIVCYKLKNQVFVDEFSWGRCWLCGLRVVFYASLIEAAAIVIYNQWINPNNLYEMQQALLAQYEEAKQLIEANGVDTDPTNRSLMNVCEHFITALRSTPLQTPVEASFGAISNDLFGGMLWMSLFATVFYRRNNS